MAIPDYQAFLLRLAADGELHRTRDAYEAMAEQFSIPEPERQELLPSGTQPLLHNRIG